MNFLIRRTLVVMLLIGLVTCKKKAVPEVAHIEQAPAAATLKRSDGSVVPAKVGTPLYEDDQVINPGEGNVVIWFPGDNRVTIAPQGSVAVQREVGGGTSVDIGAVLLEGSMHAESSGKGPRLSVGTPYGVARSGPAMTVLDVSIDKGLSVLVGQVDMEREGSIETVQQGRQLSVNGLNLELSHDREVEGLKFEFGPTKDANTAAKALPFVLYPKRGPQLLRGRAAPITVAKRMLLQPGDDVRTREAGAGSKVVLGDLGIVTLGSASEVAFASVVNREGRTEADYDIKGGAVDVHLVQVPNKPVKNTLHVSNGDDIDLEPTLRSADLEVYTGEEPRLALHFGKMQVGDTAVEAGASVRFKGGQPQVGPLAEGAVDVFEARHSVVYYDRAPPPVNFVFEGAPHVPTRIDIAFDPAFKRIVGVEQVSHGSFMYDQINPAATYFWRVNQKSPHATVQFKPESDIACNNCKRVNMIDDTGEKTVVYYQQTLPALTFRWKPTDGAKTYNLKVFRDGQFDKPLLDDKTTETSRAYPAGRFAEEKYFWLVKPTDAGGHELNAGRMNSLQIAYDNVVTALVIRTPKANAHVAEDAITTTGEVEIGTKLFCQGEPLTLDDDGRFSAPIRLRPGLNHLVYRSIGSDKIERMYVREVVHGK